MRRYINAFGKRNLKTLYISIAIIIWQMKHGIMKNLSFIEDEPLRKRLVEEFKGIRFAYKLYEGIEAKDENLIFEIRHQIFSYATIYEAVIHSVLYTYYKDTPEFHKLQYTLCLPELIFQKQN